MESRIKSLREKRGLIQEILAAELGITQQTLSVHQSFLVNYKHVDGIGYDFVVMDNGKRISISEDRRRQISEEYCAMEDTFYVGR